MGVRNVVGFTNSDSTLRRPNSNIRAVVLLVRRWRFAPRAEARSQFNQTARGRTPAPSRIHRAVQLHQNIWRALTWRFTRQAGERHLLQEAYLPLAPALRHGAAPTLATHHRRHRRRGAHAFRVWVASRRADEGPSEYGHEPVAHLALLSIPWQAKASHPSCWVQPNPSLKRSANGTPPGPVCGMLHSPQPGPGGMPSAPA